MLQRLALKYRNETSPYSNIGTILIMHIERWVPEYMPEEAAGPLMAGYPASALHPSFEERWEVPSPSNYCHPLTNQEVVLTAPFLLFAASSSY